MSELALPLLLGLPLVGAGMLAVLPGSADRLARLLALVVTGTVFAGSLALLAGFDYGAGQRMQYVVDAPWVPALDARFRLGVDGISLPLVVLTALLTFLCAVYTLRVLPAPGRPRAFLAMVLLLEVGMLGTFVATDLLLFFVFFEVVLAPMFFLIDVWGGARRSYAATKFLLYTLLGSVFLLLSVLGIWAQAGTLDLVALTERGGAGLSRDFQVLAFGGLFFAFAIKAPLWPLHTWLPDAHTEAPTVGSVLLAGVLLKMGTYGLARLGVGILPLGARELAPVLAVLAAVAIVYGALCCLGQRNVKRLIAYSSVGHMGFVLLGIATLTPTGVNAALYGNVAHGVITGLLFLLAGSLRERYGSYDMTEIGSGVLARSPYLGAVLVIAAMASLGLPGLAGFWGELLAMLAAYDPAATLSRPLFRTVMVAAGIGTVLTAAYFLRLLRRVDYGPVPTGPGRSGRADASAVELLTWAPLLVLVVALGLYPRLVFGVTDGAVRALLGAG